tara:strand:- start:921 stop:1385 length:465 start_codon:yes stop_codon:yes gene_type:complete
MYEAELRTWLHENNGPSYDTLTPEVMEAIGVDPVFEGPQATGGTVYQYSQRDGVEQIEGKWYTKYILGPVFTDSTVDGVTTTAAEAEAAYKAAKDAEQAVNVRRSRNDLLTKCDWTQIADSTADKPAWATYRQALRDVTTQEGFPWNVTWPEQP